MGAWEINPRLPVFPHPSTPQSSSKFEVTLTCAQSQSIVNLRAHPSVSARKHLFWPRVCGYQIGLNNSLYVFKKKACLAHLASSDNPPLCSSPDCYCKWLMLIVTVRVSGKLFQNDGQPSAITQDWLHSVLEFYSIESQTWWPHWLGLFSCYARITPCAAKSTNWNTSVDTRKNQDTKTV